MNNFSFPIRFFIKELLNDCIIDSKTKFNKIIYDNKRYIFTFITDKFKTSKNYLDDLLFIEFDNHFQNVFFVSESLKKHKNNIQSIVNFIKEKEILFDDIKKENQLKCFKRLDDGTIEETYCDINDDFILLNGNKVILDYKGNVCFN